MPELGPLKWECCFLEFHFCYNPRLMLAKEELVRFWKQTVRQWPDAMMGRRLVNSISLSRLTHQCWAADLSPPIAPGLPLRQPTCSAPWVTEWYLSLIPCCLAAPHCGGHGHGEVEASEVNKPWEMGNWPPVLMPTWPGHSRSPVKHSVHSEWTPLSSSCSCSEA